jgi:hypothetical protein
MRAIGIGLVLGLALVIGLIATNWTGLEPTVAVPSQDTIDACNREAATRTSQPGATVEVVKDGVNGAVPGARDAAFYGVSESRKNDERYRDAYASCMRSRGFAG